MKIKLNRPIAFFDLEATGLNLQEDRIVEIGICKLFPDGSRESKTRRINPEMPIPPSCTAIHGISDEDVKEQPTFKEIAAGLLKFIEGCDIAGYNSNHYDLPLLYNEFQRAGIIWDYHAFLKIDVGNLFKIKESRTLSAAVQFYCNRDMENAHSAEADINATVDVFLAQLDRYDDLPESLEELELFTNHGKKFLDLSGKFTFDDDGDVVFNFGPERGKKAIENISLVNWILGKDFPKDTKDVCYDILNGVYNKEKPALSIENTDDDSDLPF